MQINWAVSAREPSNKDIVDSQLRAWDSITAKSRGEFTHNVLSRRKDDGAWIIALKVNLCGEVVEVAVWLVMKKHGPGIDKLQSQRETQWTEELNLNLL